MKVEISREEMRQVLLAKIAEMDPDEAKEELWEFYAEQIYPEMNDEELAAEFYEKIVQNAIDEGEEEPSVTSESNSLPLS